MELDKIYNMDCLEGMKQIPDGSVDAIICDLPYGIVNRPKGTKETHCCLGTMEALSGRGINVRASEKDSRHPWPRPCDNKWQAWMLFPKRTIHVNSIAYIQCRVPYEQSRQLTFKFHK